MGVQYSKMGRCHGGVRSSVSASTGISMFRGRSSEMSGKMTKTCLRPSSNRAVIVPVCHFRGSGVSNGRFPTITATLSPSAKGACGCAGVVPNGRFLTIVAPLSPSAKAGCGWPRMGVAMTESSLGTTKKHKYISARNPKTDFKNEYNMFRFGATSRFQEP